MFLCDSFITQLSATDSKLFTSCRVQQLKTFLGFHTQTNAFIYRSLWFPLHNAACCSNIQLYVWVERTADALQCTLFHLSCVGHVITEARFQSTKVAAVTLRLLLWALLATARKHPSIQRGLFKSKWKSHVRSFDFENFSGWKHNVKPETTTPVQYLHCGHKQMWLFWDVTSISKLLLHGAPLCLAHVWACPVRRGQETQHTNYIVLCHTQLTGSFLGLCLVTPFQDLFTHWPQGHVVVWIPPPWLRGSVEHPVLLWVLHQPTI